MSSGFTSEFFEANRARLRELFTGTAPIVLTANGLLQRAADETYRFTQDSNFWYLTGINEPNIILVMDKGKEYLIVPELSHAKEMFDGAINPDELRERSGIEEILTDKEGWKRLGARMKRVSNVAVIAPPPAFIDSLGMYTNPARKRLIRQLKKHNLELTLLDLRQHLQRMRMVKQPAEIKALKKAIAITIDGIQQVEQKFKKEAYANEYEIELDLTAAFLGAGASGHGFDPIVAGGAKAAQIHDMSNDAQIDPNKPLLLDIGARYQNYAADISRCFSNRPDKRYDAVYAAVKDAADYAMSLLKPGVTIRDYEQKMEQYMGEKLRELGLIKIIDHDRVRHYFPHATSHFLGIDVHDFGDYDYPLEPNMILTVEPGIYIPEEGIGIRIEDDVIITADGCQNLSAKLKR